ncbi:hypothetical protein HYC85_016883 [Camellia sinensis]|uniref:Uncharacterized protein n=1 Tax=Camellia sinensis TaxID=4442 RepID=A0A7J7H268_CAMSI|nr:hypothetical protein HYC85_016883 [Camellia sinensis]
MDIYPQCMCQTHEVNWGNKNEVKARVCDMKTGLRRVKLSLQKGLLASKGIFFSWQLQLDLLAQKTRLDAWTHLLERGKTNFFETRVGEYQKASVMNSLNGNGGLYVFKLDEDF